MSPKLERSSKSTPVTQSGQLSQPKWHQKENLYQDDDNHDSRAFNNLLCKINQAFNRPDNMVDVDQIWQSLDDYKSDERDWSKFAYYDPNKYKRNFVEGGEKYDIMIISWAPGAKSCIHDHSGSHCFMKVLKGELVESRFAWPNGNGEMRKTVDTYASLNEVLYINGKSLQVALSTI